MGGSVIYLSEHVPTGDEAVVVTVLGQGFGGAAYSLATRLGLTSAESSSHKSK
jgi:hypothetical protein